MSRPKKYISRTFKLPLMWVMLLWAFTMPGHEVLVYEFLLSLIPGKQSVTHAQSREEISRSQEQSQISHAFVDAVHTFSGGKNQLQPFPFLAASYCLWLLKPVAYFCCSGGSVTWPIVVKKLLLIAVLPNAP